MEESRAKLFLPWRISLEGREELEKVLLTKIYKGSISSGRSLNSFYSCEQSLEKSNTFFFRIGLAVLVQMLVTAALVLAVNFGLETSVRSNMVETFACQIVGAVLICAAWICAQLRLVTAWPLGIIYLIVPCVSFGIIFGAISITYADASSFLVATGFSCGFFVVANFALFWFSTGKHFVNLNGWLISFGDASLSDDWVVVAMSIYMDFALVSVLRCLILF